MNCFCALRHKELLTSLSLTYLFHFSALVDSALRDWTSAVPEVLRFDGVSSPAHDVASVADKIIKKRIILAPRKTLWAISVNDI